MATRTALPQQARKPGWEFLRRAGSNRSIQIGLAICALTVILSLGAPLFALQSPTQMSSVVILNSPSIDHPFGTDNFGRDIFSRALYGGRVSILVGATVAILTTLAGYLVGTISAFYPRLDNILMRAMDVLLAFPGILLAIGVMAILGPRLINIIIALSLVYMPRTARVVRGEILALREQDFVVAARSIGAKDRRIIARHLIPNTVGPVLVQQTFILAAAVLAESALSFLGVGIPPSVPTLGSMLSDSRSFLRIAPWMSIFPGLFISLLILGFNITGDGLRDVLDPRMKS